MANYFIQIFVLFVFVINELHCNKHARHNQHTTIDQAMIANQKFRNQLVCEALAVKEEALLKVEKYEECKKHRGIVDDMTGSKCRYGESSMQKSFRDLEYMFSDIKGMLDIPEYKYLFADLPLLKYREVNGAFTTHGSKYCGDIFNRTEQHESNLCPWHYVLTYRFDRYPHFQTQVRCNCIRCPFVNSNRYEDFHYECKPIIKTQPAMIRDGCVNDTYVWRPALEEVSVACACMRHEPSIPIKTIQY
jgi:hypothetical protein